MSELSADEKTLELLVEAERKLTRGHARFRAAVGNPGSVTIIGIVDDDGVEHLFTKPIPLARLISDD